MPKDKDVNKRLARLMNGSDDSIDALLQSYEKELEKNYRSALEGIKKDIAKMYEKYGDNVKYSDIASYNRLTNLQQQIESKIKDLTKANIKTTERGIKSIFSETYYQTAYSFETATELNGIFGLLNDKVIDASVLNTFDSIGWPERMKANANLYNRQLKETLSQGLIQGHGYAKMARGFSDKTGVEFNRAIRIMRTEGGRAQSAAKVLAFDKFEDAAESEGFKTNRIWVSTLDGRTRDTHRSMDGQKADKNGNFTLPGGAKTEGPRLSGIASEDIGCRCTTIGEIEGLENQFRKDNDSKDRTTFKSYDDWAIEKGVKLRTGIKTDDIGFNKFKRFTQEQYGKSFTQFNLTEDEAGAIKYYTSDDRKINALNKRLREGTATKNDKTIEKVLNNALSKLPDYNAPVYRGIKISDTEKFIKDYTTGKEINFKQFVSTSFSKTEKYYGNVEYEIFSKAGKDVSELSFKPKEKEILFKTDAKFKVANIENIAGKIYIRLKEI